MLTDTKLRNLKPEAKAYKVSDRDGLYVTVLTTGIWYYAKVCRVANVMRPYLESLA